MTSASLPVPRNPEAGHSHLFVYLTALLFALIGLLTFFFSRDERLSTVRKIACSACQKQITVPPPDRA
jgi:hypothetical protein